MDMNSKLRLMAWQIDLIEFERMENATSDHDRPGGHPPQNTFAWKCLTFSRRSAFDENTPGSR